MSKRKPAPKVHRVPTAHRTPRTVPNAKRPINERGPSPMGLPPAGFKPGWQLVRGEGTTFHTHS